MPYYPSRDDWEAQSPADLHLSPERLAAAIEYHRPHETRWRRDFITASGRYIGVADEPPAPGDVLGPVEPRGGPNGLVIRGGRIAVEWGDTERVDMTFSIAKSYLSVLAGVAVDRGLIRDTGDAAVPSAPASSFSARGAGSNVIWIDSEHDLVVVVRWIDRGHVEGFLRLVLDSVEG